ncbi:MAG TPA: flippase [Flavitalea sp.]|nr:flippase [Flavitalea sp.]
MKKGLIKNIFSLGIVQIANFAFPVITVLVVSRIIGPDKFGVINFAGAFVTYFTLLINFGFDLSATRVIAANRDNLEERNRIFNQVILAKLLLLGLSVVLFVASLFLIPQLRQEKTVAIFSFLLCLSWVITPTWLYQGMQELSRVAIFNLSTKVLSTLVIVLVIRVKSDYIWQPLALSLAQIAVGIYAFFFAIRRYRITLYWAPLKPVLKMLWTEKLLFFSTVVVNLYTTTNVVILGFMQSDTQVGYYTAGWRLITVVQALISLPLSQALFPFIGTAFAGGRERGLEVVRQLFPVVTLITLVAALMMWLFGPMAILLFYGEKFAPAIAVFRILVFIPIMIGWSHLLGIQTMINLKKDKMFFWITACGALLSLGLNVLLVSHLGFIGSAWSWLITEMLITLMMFSVLYRDGIMVLKGKYFHPSNFLRIIQPIVVGIRKKMNK